MWPGRGIVQLSSTALVSEAYVGHVRYRQNDEAMEEIVEFEMPAVRGSRRRCGPCLAMSAARAKVVWEQSIDGLREWMLGQAEGMDSISALGGKRTGCARVADILGRSLERSTGNLLNNATSSHFAL
jgi:hypothetical protein